MEIIIDTDDGTKISLSPNTTYDLVSVDITPLNSNPIVFCLDTQSIMRLAEAVAFCRYIIDVERK